MPQVRMSYSTDPAQIGTVVDVDGPTARRMVREGRGVVVEPAGDLVEKSKAELLAEADALGVDVPAKASKADLADLIREAEAGG